MSQNPPLARADSQGSRFGGRFPARGPLPTAGCRPPGRAPGPSRGPARPPPCPRSPPAAQQVHLPAVQGRPDSGFPSARASGRVLIPSGISPKPAPPWGNVTFPELESLWNPLCRGEEGGQTFTTLRPAGLHPADSLSTCLLKPGGITGWGAEAGPPRMLLAHLSVQRFPVWVGMHPRNGVRPAPKPAFS